MTEQPEDTVERLVAAVAEYARLKGGTNSTSQSEIHIHAGGFGVWVATTACLVMLGMMFVAGFWISKEISTAQDERSELRSEVRDAKDYISATYQIAPEIQKRLEESKKSEKKDHE